MPRRTYPNTIHLRVIVHRTFPNGHVNRTGEYLSPLLDQLSQDDLTTWLDELKEDLVRKYIKDPQGIETSFPALKTPHKKDQTQ